MNTIIEYSPEREKLYKCYELKQYFILMDKAIRADKDLVVAENLDVFPNACLKHNLLYLN